MLIMCSSPYDSSRYPNSLPTRRSSDLVGERLWNGAAGGDAEGTRDGARRDQALASGLAATAGAGDTRRGRAGGRRHPAIEDRKSTRLNSSHPSISYAVFCLTEKKPLHR